MRGWLASRLRDPLWWADASQLIKTVMAAAIAWVVAVDLFHLTQAFMAPWAALLTVHTTIFGTARGGVRQAGASVLGVLIAFSAGHLLGLTVISLAAAVLAGLIVGAVPGVRAETTTAATAVVVLTTGYADKSGILGDRLLDTGIGIGVGLLVNLLIWPPLRDRGAAREIDAIDDRVGGLLREIAAALRARPTPEAVDGWLARTDELNNDIDRSWLLLQEARESGRLNPRRAAPMRMHATEDLLSILNRLAQAIAEIRSMARTIRIAHVPVDAWDPTFREPWLGLLGHCGAAVESADADGIRTARAELEELSHRLQTNPLPELWAVYGALLVNLRNILDVLDVVAEAQPVTVPSTKSTSMHHPR